MRALAGWSFLTPTRQSAHRHGLHRCADGCGRWHLDGRSSRWIGQRVHRQLWRSLKHEDVSLKGYADGGDAQGGIGKWFGFYNNTRAHQALGSRTPMAVWREGIGGGLPDMAVGMTPRVDNAKALPTCPQQLQQIAA